MSLEISLTPASVANSETTTVTAVTSHSSQFTADLSAAVVTVDVDTYYRMSEDSGDTVSADGTEALLLAHQQYRLYPIPVNNYLHFVRVANDGNVWITPE